MVTEQKRDVVPIEEIAQRLELNINGVYAALRRGEIPGRQIGRRWIVTRLAFERFLAGEGEPRAA